MESDEPLKVDKVESFIYFPPFRWPVIVCNFSLIASYNHYIHGQFHRKVQDNTIAN
jgi:hypothetical protein